MSQRNISVIDLICMDVQGSELKVLYGMGANLQNVRYIICEGQYVPLYEGSPLIYDIHDYLTSRGFKLLPKNLLRPSAKKFNNFVYKNRRRGFWVSSK